MPLHLFRTLVVTGMSALFVAFALKCALDWKSSRERGRLVVNMIQEQVSLLSASEVQLEELRKTKVWPSEFAPLQQWLVLSLMKQKKPEVVLADLDQLSLGKSYSPSIRNALTRWRTALIKWSRSEVFADADDMSSDVLLREGRLRYNEASGYDRAGLSYDATALYLWSGALLMQFIQKNPEHPKVPEALFMFGNVHLKIQSSFPKQVRADRILNLCTELYPESIWAIRAHSIRQDIVVRGRFFRTLHLDQGV